MDSSAYAFPPFSAGHRELHARLDALVNAARLAFLQAQEAEVVRLLALWPADHGDPVLAYDMEGNLVGLARNLPVGEPADIVVFARRIRLCVATDKEGSGIAD